MKFEKDGFYFLPLGGTGEIGMNLNVYGHQGKWLIVDLGVTFGDDTLPMVDVVMADPAFIEERQEDLVGIVITHAHEDHIGAIPYLWSRLRCPIYATPFAAALIRHKMIEAQLDAKQVFDVTLGSRFKVGPFDLEMVGMTHSIPEPNSIAIHTPYGTVLHTGDWKFDPDPLVGEPADFEKLRRLGRDGVLAVVGDSTNVFSKGETRSESEVRASLIELLGRYKQRIAVSCFATNVARLESIALAAEANGRSVALVGRSLWRMERVARELGYLDHIAPFLDDREATALPSDKIVYICTGSQGEARAALHRISAGEHPNVKLGKGDVVLFSSRVIPGNEKAILRIQNQLVSNGVQVVTDRDEFIHVSGHPARGEIERYYELVRPQVVIPVHGEARHIQEHCDLGKALGAKQALAIENGDVIRLGPGPVEVVGQVAIGRLAQDGTRLVSVESPILRDRRRMVFNGSAVCTIVANRKGFLVCDPIVSALGLLDSEDPTSEYDEVVSVARDTFMNLSPSVRIDDAAAAEAVRRSVRRCLKDMLGHKPITTVHFVRV